MADFIKVVNHGNNPLDLRHLAGVVQLRPVELHYNTTGSIENKPTLGIVMTNNLGINVVGQFSLKTLEDCLDELGYELKAK